MTTTTSPASTSTPATPAKAEPITAMVQLRAASSQMQFRILAACYLGLMAYAWLPGAIAAGIVLPLFCAPTHPRRALWLWAAGLLAGGMALMKGRGILADLGGIGQAFDKSPTWAGVGVALAVVGVLLMVWHLTWVKSPRRSA